MAEELSDVASLLTGKPVDTEAEKPEPVEAEPAQEITPSAPQDAAVDPSVETPPATLTVKQVAETLDTTPKKLYESLMIDIGGQQMSLSEVKDRGKELFGAEQKLTAANAHKLDSENDVLRMNQALSLREQRLGGKATHAEQQEAQTRHNEWASSEREKTLAVIPEWNSLSVQEAEVKLIGEMLVDAGFSQHEINNKIDHRDAKIYREYAVLKDRLKNVSTLEVHKTQNQQPGAKRKSAPTNKSAKERYAKGELTQTQAVLQAIADGNK